jgi:hypothetical protein
LRGTLPGAIASLHQASEVLLESRERTPFELDGEWVGHLPARLFIEGRRLRVIGSAAGTE